MTNTTNKYIRLKIHLVKIEYKTCEFGNLRLGFCHFGSFLCQVDVWEIEKDVMTLD